MSKVVRGLLVEILGWILLVAGLAALFLPGPGLLGLFGGLALLSTRYEWAERRVDPIRLRALKGAADSVATWPRIIASTAGALALAACGVLWIVKPPVPQWWWFDDVFWLPGGHWTGITQIASAVLALALVVYSYRRFHGKPLAVVELGREIADADHELHEDRDERREERAERRELRADRREERAEQKAERREAKDGAGEYRDGS